MPTGWMYEMKRHTFPVREKGPCKIHLVPYSEHSSYKELRDYVQFLRPAQASCTGCLLGCMQLNLMIWRPAKDHLLAKISMLMLGS